MGCYKADIFRIFLLYHQGGYYIDSDVEPRISLKNIIDENVTFSSVISLDKQSIFQAYLASNAFNPILKINLDILYKYYSKNMSLPSNMGTKFLADSLKTYTNQKSLEIIGKNKFYSTQNIHLLQEKVYDDKDAKYILNLRKKCKAKYPELFTYAIYDPITNLYPFWSRFACFKTQTLRNE